MQEPFISPITVDHIRWTSTKPFAEVTRAFVEQLGVFDLAVVKSLMENSNANEARTTLQAMAGPNGMGLFNTANHGALFRLIGHTRRALQYLVGNPLIALSATQHDIRVALYAPLRVLIYEDAAGNTCIEYDRPSSLFGQFGNNQAKEVGLGLDQKLQALVTRALK
jgi:uncharacterized protein (DUF302 family)